MATDPVAEKSSFLCMYMSGHPDTLVAYAKHYGKVSGAVKSAQMTSITTKVINLKCTFTNGSEQDVSIPIEPPLKGYEDVKPRLLEMKSIAQEALGMIKTPQISSFTFPPAMAITGGAALCLLYTVAPIFWDIPQEYLWLFSFTNNFLRPTFSDTLLKGISYFTIVVHALEAVYISHLARKHTSFFVGSQYVLGALIFGMPVLTGMRRKIQAARIDSVMKVE